MLSLTCCLDSNCVTLKCFFVVLLAVVRFFGGHVFCFLSGSPFLLVFSER